MSNLKEEYDKIIEQRKKILEEMKPLGENEIVKRYMELTEQNESLFNQQLSLYKELKMEKYASCDHILVYSQIDYDRYEGRTYKSCGCIKCGLDNSVLNGDREWLSGSRQIMYDYLRKNRIYNKGIASEVLCDLDLAQAIYSKIKQAHPDIDDETARKYFEIALDDIRNIKVSDDRKASRAKRLSLKDNFKRWNSGDVCSN